jgi:ABC-type multidrug transport system fused ATPase/permease subunit
LIVSANLDPYAFLLANILVNEGGAELHEAYSEFPYLPLNLKGKLGLMLAYFGHWNRFHVHAMPFTSEPRIYKEYAGGMLALKGFELSWMIPVSHYIELIMSVYDRIQGHSHDTDPSLTTITDSRSVDEIAKEPVVKNITFEINSGEFVVLRGPNGCGKSTIIKSILGLACTLNGTVHWTINKTSVGYVPQETTLSREIPYTALDIACYSINFSGKRNVEMAKTALTSVKMDSKAACRFGDLSGGQKRRVLFARALVK